MPSNPAEPEKYSLDDMLERLQTQPTFTDDEGELVTRADGTQAIKVRKRKRRTSQPQKEAARRAARLRVIRFVSAVTLLVLLGLALGALVVYSNSAPYKAGVVAKFDTASGARTDLIQFRVNPTGTNAVRADFTWPEGNILKFLSVGDIRAKGLFGGLTGGAWSVQEISASTGNLQLDTPRSDKPRRFSPAASGNPPVSFERLGISNLDVTVGDPVSPALRILQTEASFYPKDLQGIPSVRLFLGSLKMTDWPDFRINRALIEFKPKQTEIVTLRLLHHKDNSGSIDLSGGFDPYTKDATQALAVKMDSYHLSGILPESLGRLISARIDSRNDQPSNKFTVSPESPGGHLHVAFSASPTTPLRLNGFPFLSTLSQATGTPWYIEPIFDDGCTGILEREAGAIRLTNLSFTARNQLKVTGELSLSASDILSGTLRIGVPEGVLMASKSARIADLFGENSEGFRWITLEISGTGQRPSDNFRELYKAAEAPAGKNAPGSLFDELTAPK